MAGWLFYAIQPWSASRVELSWTQSTEENWSHYNVLRSTTSGSGYVQVNTAPIYTNSYVDTTVSPATNYFYVIRSVSLLGDESANSSEIFASTYQYARFPFPTPPSNLQTGAGYQEFRLRVAKGVGIGTPLVRMELYEGGVFRATLLSDTSITSTTPVILSAPWDASLLTDVSGAGVELRIFGTPPADSTPLDSTSIRAEWNRVVAAGGGAALTRTVTDAIAVVESVPRKMARPATDAIAVAESVPRRVARPATDAIAVSDSMTRKVARLNTDTIGITDSMTRRVARAATDSVGISDTLTRRVARLHGDTVGVTDSLLRKIARLQADTVAVVDAYTKAQGHKPTYTDALAAADSATRKMARAAADAVAAIDSYTKAQGHKPTYTDALAVADSSLRRVARAHTDTVNAADGYATALAVVRAITDAIVVSDSYSSGTAGALSRTLTDTIALADAYAKVQALIRSYTDTIPVSDAMLRRFARRHTDAVLFSGEDLFLGGVEINDSYSALQDINRVFTDAVSIADASQADIAGIISRTLTDALAISDTLARRFARVYIDGALYPGETLYPGDSTFLGGGVGISDFTSTLTPKTRTVSDVLGVSDSHTRRRGRYHTETIALTDVLSRSGNISWIHIDSVPISDYYEYKGVYAGKPLFLLGIVGKPEAMMVKVARIEAGMEIKPRPGAKVALLGKPKASPEVVIKPRALMALKGGTNGSQ